MKMVRVGSPLLCLLANVMMQDVDFVDDYGGCGCVARVGAFNVGGVLVGQWAISETRSNRGSR
jgi:hypothetical protein